MRKIVRKEERVKKTRKNQLYMGIFLIIIMIFSTLGFAFINNTTQNQNNLNRIEFAGIEFASNGDFWFFNFQGQDFVTRHNPIELANISFANYNNIQNYHNKPLYFVGESGEHFSELDRNLRDRFVLRISNACIEGEVCNEDLPIRNCLNDNIIVYKEVFGDEEERIYQDNNCYFIVSSFSNQSKYADALLFDLLEIR